MTPLAAYLLLFVAVGAGFILVHLLAGMLIRPSRPDAEKGTIYECGEPTIGSAWVQFDVRYYVVALLFVIFDVEVAFFFPWAEVFGRANAIANLPEPANAAELKQAATTLVDLAVRPDVATDVRARAEAASRLTPQGVAALDALLAEEREARSASPRRSSTISILGEIPATQLGMFSGVKPEVYETLKAEATRLEPALKKLASARKEAVAELMASLKPPDSQQPWAKGPEVVSEDYLKKRSLAELTALEPVLSYDRINPLETVRARLLRTARGALTAADARVAPVQAELVRQVNVTVAAIEKSLPGSSSKGVRDLTWETIHALGSLPDSARQSLASGELGPQLILALRKGRSSTAPGEPEANLLFARARVEARYLAWLALIEVLVFFGVLLVGFAYLWRRGDIEWVRSTAAERLQASGTPREGA
jgi:NADH:ubiquinone oxidoreductase subunit 3 (subunit A)